VEDASRYNIAKAFAESVKLGAVKVKHGDESEGVGAPTKDHF
jgi:hypothetical protein